jgi:TatD DNase family protein
MSRALPPLDLHAHIDPDIPAPELEKLGAVVFAATRSSEEYETARRRRDLVTMWGVGCHPGLASAQASYNEADFAELMQTTPYVSEIGVDRQSRVPIDRQVEVLASILTLAQKHPRILSLHSVRATGQVLDVLDSSPVKGAVLHWWLGSSAETERAVNMGCWFSVNVAASKKLSMLDHIPISRLLVETDHPHGNRASAGPRQPGSVADIEEIIARHHQLTPESIRAQVWSNFSELVSETGVEHLMTQPIQRMLATSRGARNKDVRP